MKHNWEYKRLEEISVELFAGSDVPKDFSKEQSENYPYPIFTNGVEYEGLYGFCRNPRVSKSAITIASRGTIGVVFKRDSPFTPAIRLITVVPKDIITVSFLAHFIKSKNLSGNGVTIPQLTVPMVRSIRIPVPPMEEQEEIVAELDKLNDMIATRKKQLKELDNLAQSLFYDTFGDPITNPKGWPISKLKNLTSLITNGTTPKGGQAVYVDSGVIFFRSQNVWRNKIIMDDIAYLDKSTNASMKGSMLKHNDILITKTGRINTENSSLGRSALFKGADDTANINGHVYLVRLNEGMCPRFVLSILLSPSFHDLIRKVCVGAIDKRQLNLTHIEKFPIITPPLELQERFVAQIELIEKQKEVIETSICELQTFLDSRMDYWFN